MKFWYAVQTKPHSESFAGASLQHLDVEVFLPVLREKKVIRGKYQTSTVPMFPGYLFVRCTMPSQYRTVAYARGVKQFVSFGSGPAIVDDSIVEVIRSQENNEVAERPERSFVPGQVVRINGGPLFGLEAIFQRPMSGVQRAVLLLKTISYQARVIVDSQLVANL